MNHFEYTQAFVSLPYKTRTAGLLFKSTNDTADPDIDAFLNSAQALGVMNQHGREGWELVSVQQIFRGHDQIGNQNAQSLAYVYTLSMGFLLFFKRSIAAAQPML
ncbi:DUF4177 domain-containing protein [Pseudomonas cichorii]|nr:DUF4177 domain-containing protein [Pseudomonas cichorii]